MPRLSITSTFEIAAAHELPYHQGKCKRPHGHNYRLEFTRYGEIKRPRLVQVDAITRGGAVVETNLVPADQQDSDTGMIEDFGNFDGVIKDVLSQLDHYRLNDLPGLGNPTAEHLALWLLEQLPGVDKVVVWETGRHCATAER
jgi:6-pyruvoyltetrahydropterin/6-carboxytetrahydropterin synthase